MKVANLAHPTAEEAQAFFGATDFPFAPHFARRWDRRAHQHIPRAAGQQHHIIPDAIHLIQKDAPAELVERILHFVESVYGA